MSNTKSIAVSIAVLIFFVVAILSFIAGCAPDTCCGRALLGAAAAYLIASWALRTIFNIAYDALAGTKQADNQRAQYVGTDTDGQRN